VGEPETREAGDPCWVTRPRQRQPFSGLAIQEVGFAETATARILLGEANDSGGKG